jgi:hypothetical protein
VAVAAQCSLPQIDDRDKLVVLVERVRRVVDAPDP